MENQFTKINDEIFINDDVNERERNPRKNMKLTQ